MATFAGAALPARKTGLIRWPLAWPSLLKNRTFAPHRPMSPAVNITGTAACSCSAPGVISKNWRNSARISWPPARKLWQALTRILILCALTSRPSWTARMSPSTTRLWKKPLMRSWFRWMRAGATSAPGHRCGKSAPKILKAMCITATLSATRLKTAISMPSPAW